MIDAGPLVVDEDDPCLQGHFPGNPLVPAVAILDRVVEEIARRLGKAQAPWLIQTAKFLEPLRPGEDLTIELDDTNEGSVRFTCKVGTRRVALGSMALRPRSY